MPKTRWPYLVVLPLLIIAGVAWSWSCGTHTTVLLVRHADRNGKLDELTAAGVARAAVLAQVAAKSGIDAIVSSSALRTQHTAAPVADATGLTPVLLEPNDIDAFVAAVDDHRGETILIVGHSNTVPQIIAALGGPALPEIDEQEFDNLFVLERCRCRRGTAPLTNLQYGTLSP